jgi:hypothetical protein
MNAYVKSVGELEISAMNILGDAATKAAEKLEADKATTMALETAENSLKCNDLATAQELVNYVMDSKRRACSSAGRAPALQAGGRGFESPHVHQMHTLRNRKMWPKSAQRRFIQVRLTFQGAVSSHSRRRDLGLEREFPGFLRASKPECDAHICLNCGVHVSEFSVEPASAHVCYF